MSKRSLKSELETVRRYTGEKFTAKNGYDLRAGLNFGQKMAVLKYHRKIQELTRKPYVEYTPKRGEKTEAFNYTGQKGYRAFTKALIYHPDPSHQLSFEVDRSLPKGSRFTVLDKGPKNAPRSPSKYFHIPAKYFVTDWSYYAETFEEYIQLILDEYAPDAELFLIQAGDSYMWGAGAGRNSLAEKLETIMTNYSASFYDVNDKNSSYYGNWFRGVMAFTRRDDAFPAIRKGLEAKRERAAKYKLDPNIKYRRLRNGQVVGMQDGRVVVPPFWIEEE